MTQFYILEIQSYQNGEYGHIVHFAYDEDPVMARLKAESKYHQVLASAAVSELPQHSATLIATDGRCIMYQDYHHPIPEPEPEPEETVVPEPQVSPGEPVDPEPDPEDPDPNSEPVGE